MSDGDHDSDDFEISIGANSQLFLPSLRAPSTLCPIRRLRSRSEATNCSIRASAQEPHLLASHVKGGDDCEEGQQSEAPANNATAPLRDSFFVAGQAL